MWLLWYCLLLPLFSSFCFFKINFYCYDRDVCVYHFFLIHNCLECAKMLLLKVWNFLYLIKFFLQTFYRLIKGFQVYAKKYLYFFIQACFGEVLCIIQLQQTLDEEAYLDGILSLSCFILCFPILLHFSVQSFLIVLKKP